MEKVTTYTLWRYSQYGKLFWSESEKWQPEYNKESFGDDWNYIPKVWETEAEIWKMLKDYGEWIIPEDSLKVFIEQRVVTTVVVETYVNRQDYVKFGEK